MVEGPGVAKNRVKAASFVGRRCMKVVSSAATGPAEHAANGRLLVDVLVLGKELFLIFGAIPNHGGPAQSNSDDSLPETALRFHFGMSGSLRLDAGQSFMQPKLTLRLEFEALSHGATSKTNASCMISCFDASVSSVNAAATRAKVASQQQLDVCSPHFNARQSATALKARTTHKMLTDALLDQAAMPGCGNIIKNEALARARVDPRRRVRTLNFQEVDRVVAEVRDYSMTWLKKHPSKPPKVVYDQVHCGLCGGSVALAKLGEDSLRPTFWCNACLAAKKQSTSNNELSSSSASPSAVNTMGATGTLPPSSSLPTQNVNGGKAGASHAVNMMSNASAPSPAAVPLRAWLGLNNATSAANQCTNRQEGEFLGSGTFCGTAGVVGELKKRPLTALEPATPAKAPTLSPPTSSNTYNGTPSALPTSAGATFTATSGATAVAGAVAMPGPAFFCRLHGPKSRALKRVRKEGPNAQRLFFGCNARSSSSIRGSAAAAGGSGYGSQQQAHQTTNAELAKARPVVSKCSHFAWADAHFPPCKCSLKNHSSGNGGSVSGYGARSAAAGQKGAVVLARLRVSKKEATGGKWFFSCGQRSCDFFAWATPAQLAPLGDALTPLL